MPREFNSWKEIADHLGVTVRTAQRWEEERGLPVTRLPGGRGRVSARIEELDRWRDREDPGGRPLPHQDWGVPLPGPATARRRRLFRRLAAAATLLAAAAAGLYYLFALPGQPATWKMEGRTLVVSDERRRAVWHHEFDGSLYEDPYRSSDPHAPSAVWITDLEGDGDRETLFIEMKHDSAVLYCFSAQGAVRGADEAGRAFELESQVENISASGLHMRMARRVDAGSVLFVVVKFAQPPAEPADSAGLIAHGEVVRSEIEPDGTCGVALCFSSYRPL